MVKESILHTAKSHMGRKEYEELLKEIDRVVNDAYQRGLRDGMSENDSLPSNVSPHSFGVDSDGRELPVPCGPIC